MTSGDQNSRSDNEVGPVSSDSKKRSKLGYHRTAVACSHCRRRKIRCVPSSDLPEAKCQNCIRLKKECHFHPVDQQDIPSKKSRSGLKTDAGSADGTARRVSPSPESSVDAPLSRVDPIGSSSTVPSGWEQNHFVNSPSTQISGYVFGQQTWAPSIPGHVQGPYIRHHSLPGPAAAQYYLPADVASTLNYGQRQFMPITTAPLPTESRPIYNNPTLDEVQYYGRRPNFSPVRSSSALQEPTSNQYTQSFSGPERRTTLPLNYANHSSQLNAQLQSDLGQYTLPSQFAGPSAQETLYSQNTQQQNYASHRSILLGEDQRREHHNCQNSKCSNDGKLGMNCTRPTKRKKSRTMPQTGNGIGLRNQSGTRKDRTFPSFQGKSLSVLPIWDKTAMKKE